MATKESAKRRKNPVTATKAHEPFASPDQDYPVKPWVNPATGVRFRTIAVRLDDGSFLAIVAEDESIRATAKTQAEADSSKERESILADAKRDMERLVEQSRQEVDRIARGIERDIKGKIADAVVERAGRTLETQMTEDDQKRVVVRFLNKV